MESAVGKYPVSTHSARYLVSRVMINLIIQNRLVNNDVKSHNVLLSTTY